MSGAAFERARRRVGEALDAGTVAMVDGAPDARMVDTDVVLAMHTGVPGDATSEWALSFARRTVRAIGAGADPVAMIAGLATQGMLTGFFTAEEIAKDGGR